MTTRQVIIGLVNDHLNWAVLLLDGQQANCDVINFHQTHVMNETGLHPSQFNTGYQTCSHTHTYYELRF
jgi:hypothetical protein